MLRKDKRVKRCPNGGCGRNQNQFHFTSDDIYCTECKCGLVFACSKCGKKIEDEGPSHTLCERCKAEGNDKLAHFKGVVFGAAGATAAAAFSAVRIAAKIIPKKG